MAKNWQTLSLLQISQKLKFKGQQSAAYYLPHQNFFLVTLPVLPDTQSLAAIFKTMGTVQLLCVSKPTEKLVLVLDTSMNHNNNM